MLRSYLILCICLASPALAADVLIRFPASVPLASVSPIIQEIENLVNRRARGATALPWNLTDIESPPDAALKALAQARDAYKHLEFEKSQQFLNNAMQHCLDQFGAIVCRPVLFESYLRLGVIADAMGQPESAAYYYRSAHLIDPRRVVDPRQYPPQTIRSFNRACTSNEQTGIFQLVSIPPGARFQINGESVANPESMRLNLGRHLLEAELAGYANQRQLIDVERVDSQSHKIQLELTPLAEVDAWTHLRKILSTDPKTARDQPGWQGLLNRFGIDQIIWIETSNMANGFETAFMQNGNAPATPLGKLGLPGEPLPVSFRQALTAAFGIQPLQQLPQESEMNIELEDPNVLDDDLEEESEPVIDDPNGVSPSDSDAEKIIKSPWFWISVGVVVAVVGGVVIGTQIE